MRRLSLLVVLALLIGGLITLQRYRFEKIPGSPVVSLEDLHAMVPSLPAGVTWIEDKGTRQLQLVAKNDHPSLAMGFELNSFGSAEALHITFQLEADALVCGRENWDDGRLLVNWHALDGSIAKETDPVNSVRENERPDETAIVVRPSSPPARPTLHVENLGQSGTLTLSKMEITSVRERTVWRAGRWALLAGWLLWLYFALGVRAEKPPWRRALASVLWVGMGVFFVFPGPWANLRPMVAPFDLGKNSAPTSWTRTIDHDVPPKVPNAEKPAPGTTTESLGRVEPREGWILTAKRLLKKQRILVHMMMLFFPTLAFAYLLGWRQAFMLGGTLSLSIEAAQLGFGYGFDVKDVGDLAFDLLGILAALWAWKVISKKLRDRMTTPQVEEAAS